MGVARLLDASHRSSLDRSLAGVIALSLLGPAWIHLGHAPALYGGRVSNHLLLDVPQLLAPHIFFGNLFFLQGIFTPVFGSDTALWSLAYEFWYYILFPLAAVALWPRARWVHRLICAALFVATAWFIRGGILVSFPIWLAGAALFKVPPPTFNPRTAKYLRVAATLIYLPVFFVLNKIHSIPDRVNDYLLAVATFSSSGCCSLPKSVSSKELAAPAHLENSPVFPTRSTPHTYRCWSSPPLFSFAIHAGTRHP